MKNRRLPRLPRGWRIARNLTLALLILAYIWNWYGCPIPDPRLNFRRAEWRNMIGPSDIQGVFQAGEWDHSCWVVGREEDQVVLLTSRNWSGGLLYFWPKAAEGPALVPVPTRQWSEFGREREIMAVDVPEGTASARLELTMGCWHCKDLSFYQMTSASPEAFDEEPLWWERTCTADGALLKDGGVLFRVISPDEHTDASVNIATVERTVLGQVVNWDTYRRSANLRGIDCHMEAVFYDKTGAELGRAALATPEGGGTNGE